MKSFNVFLLGVLFSFLCSTQIFAENSRLQCADSAIVIIPFLGEGDEGLGPRAPMIVPISASYERLISSVILAFTSNLGEIEVEVVNTTTGGYDAGTIDTQLLYATVPITMGPGHYLIIFTLPSGRQYKGEFDC